MRTSGERLAALLIVIALVGHAFQLHGKPRPPFPPLPEGQLAAFRFNNPADPADGRATLAAHNLHTVENWSGYALEMSGAGPTLLALPEVTTVGKTNLIRDTGTIRLWFAPGWTSASEGGAGPGAEARLLEVGAWSGPTAVAWWSLGISADGNLLRFVAQGGGETLEVLRAPLAWCAGDWHQVALSWSPQETILYLDGQPAVKGPGVALAPLAQFDGTRGFCLGSDVSGGRLAQGWLDEVFLFPRVCRAEEIAGNLQQLAATAALGPVTLEEELALAKLAASAQAARPPALASASLSSERSNMLQTLGDCASQLATPILTSDGVTTNLTIRVTDATPGKWFDVFVTTELAGNSITDSLWRAVAKATNGQTVTLPAHGRYPHAFYVLGCDQDSDADGLTDAFEVLVSKSSPSVSNSLDSALLDRDAYLRSNILVNDPAQDYGTDQNTQSETTLIAFDDSVIAAYVDSNLGVTGYGLVDDTCGPTAWLPPTNIPPQFIGWAVSRDGGTTFTDKGSVPPSPLFDAIRATNSAGEGYFTKKQLGNAGDPVLARDDQSGLIYLVGIPQRPSIYFPDGTNNPPKLYVPLWRSIDNGESFLPPTNAAPGVAPRSLSDFADKPALIVDNLPGPGQGDVYMAIQWTNVMVCRSAAGATNWQVINFLGPLSAKRPSFVIVTNDSTQAHEICLTWFDAVNHLFFSKSTNRGTNFGTPVQVLTLSNATVGIDLGRTRSSPGEDKFRAPINPTLIANPVNGHLYIVYHDVPTNGAANPNIYFVQSTNGGNSWSPQRIQVDTATNSPETDQWQPAVTVKPDGTKLFIAWYDRRNDSASNSLIQTYGVFANLPISGPGSFSANFPISTVSYPPVFTGTNDAPRAYDPLYPPFFSALDPRCPGSFGGAFRDHMGDYDAAVSDSGYIYYTWGDNRLRSMGTTVQRYQADVRLMKTSWPQ